MSTKIENVVYRASWRDEILADSLASEFFNSVGPGRCSGQSGKELVLAVPFQHREMERQATEVGRSVSGGFSDTEQQRGSKFRAQSSG
jgi:hypothetical protein